MTYLYRRIASIFQILFRVEIIFLEILVHIFIRVVVSNQGS